LVPEGEPDAGLNQREVDIYNSWNKIVDAAFEEKPDVFIHAGDFFDRVRPSNIAISKAREGLYKLSEAGIPVIVIAGNHETPKMIGTGHVFQLLTRIPNVHVIYSGKPEKVKIGEIMFTGVSHSSNLAENVEAAKPDIECKQNVLITHGSISGAGIKVFENNELNQTTLPLSIFNKEWDYIALGHYHDFTKVKGNMYYSGSPERLTFGDKEDSKGYAIVKLPEFDITPKQIECREFVDLNCDYKKCNNEDLTEKLIDIVKKCEPGAKIVRLKIKNLKTDAWSAVDRKAIIKIAKDAVAFQFTTELEEQDNITASGSEIGSLREEFNQFMDKFGFEYLNPDEKNYIMKKAEDVLE